MRECPACTFKNDDDASTCDVCDEPLEAAAAPAAAAPVNAVAAWHQEGLRLIARETDDRVRTASVQMKDGEGSRLVRKTPGNIPHSRGAVR